VKAITTGNEITIQFPVLTVFAVAEYGTGRFDAGEFDIIHLEVDRSAGSQPGIDQIFDHLTLTIDPDRPATGKVAQGNPVTVAVEAQLDAMVNQAFTPESVSKTGFTQQVNRALLENAGPDALLNVLAAARLQYNRINAIQVQ
jgi:hypothetical protein